MYKKVPPKPLGVWLLSCFIGKLTERLSATDLTAIFLSHDELYLDDGETSPKE